MYTDRRAILSLVALGRITPTEAERLIAACSSDGQVWWMLAGCALCAGLVQLHPHSIAWITHIFSPATGVRSLIEGWIPAIHHAAVQIAAFFGGNL